MSIMMGDLRAALINAGADEDLANKAATEVATYDVRLANIETPLSTLTWMATVNLGLITLVLGSMLGVWFKLGEVGSQVALLVHR